MESIWLGVEKTSICHNILQQDNTLELNTEAHYMFGIVDILVLWYLFIGSKYCIVAFLILQQLLMLSVHCKALTATSLLNFP